MKVMRKIIEIDEERCDGCGECVNACVEGALRLVGGKARLVSETYCDGLGACIGECPQDAIRIVERETEPFSEPPAKPLACPSAVVREVDDTAGDQDARGTRTWPIQMRLVPSTAPFLQDADVLIAADCVPVACRKFHEEIAQDRIIMMGCPKFDDVDLYVERLTEMFRVAPIKSVTVAVMEVPCCQALKMLVRKALARSEKNITYQEITVALKGSISR